MKKYVSISGVFRDITKRVSVRVMPELKKYGSEFTEVQFIQGHYKEIAAELKRRTESQTGKYKQWPLIGLLRDFPEGAGQPGFYSEPTLTFIIATFTQPDYNSEQREQKSFIPVLYPVYNTFIDEIGKDKRIDIGYAEPVHTKIDHYFWGNGDADINGKDANIFGDYTDCIEIRDLTLKIKLIC